ncbi:MAG: hypothetical protein AAGC68_12665, partial [Verrucomicrobiota bacterium]
DGKVDFDTNEKVYVERLSFEQNQEASDKRADTFGGKFMVIDAYGNPFRYLADPPNIDEDERKTINPTYDLWSIVDADPSDPAQAARFITNWQSQ